MSSEKTAVVLLSGGMDSATVLAVAASEGYACHCLSFDYGQRNALELRCAGEAAAAFGARSHRIARIDVAIFSGSALTGCGSVPRGGGGGGVPATYVPARNTVFLAYGLALSEAVGAESLFIGVNSVDYSGYPDCRPEFIEQFRKLARLATRAGMEGRCPEIRAPLQTMSKAEIIVLGTRLGVDYSRTLTCYDPDPAGRACGGCDSCRLRREGFRRAGIPDPTPYRPGCA